jgi:hypothetical protein
VQLGSEQEAALQDALLQRLAEKEPGFYGRPGPSRPMSKGAAPGAVRTTCVLFSRATDGRPLCTRRSARP